MGSPRHVVDLKYVIFPREKWGSKAETVLMPVLGMVSKLTRTTRLRFVKKAEKG